MIYLTRFSFPDKEEEDSFYFSLKRTCYNTLYPFYILSKCGLSAIEFEPVTILCGGNGSGKTTALKVIAGKLGLSKDTGFRKTGFFEEYEKRCSVQMNTGLPEGSRMITSDDVFDYMLNLRALNAGIDRKREELFEEYLDMKYSKFQMRSLEDYERLKKMNLSRSKTQSKYVKSNLAENVREQSNGESAWFYFVQKIGEGALYLLDEPENSLSVERLKELRGFLEDSARFFGCQFLIATHSPFLLSMKGAKIYDLDANPAKVTRWTEIGDVRTYYDFFKEHSDEFEA